MRVNVYDEELTGETEVTSTTAATGKTFYGARVFLKSPDDLHHTEDDDDRSAITFWVRTEQNATILADALRRAVPPGKTTPGQ